MTALYAQYIMMFLTSHLVTVCYILEGRFTSTYQTLLVSWPHSGLLHDLCHRY